MNTRPINQPFPSLPLAILAWSALFIICTNESRGQEISAHAQNGYESLLVQSAPNPDRINDKSADEIFALAREAGKLANSGKRTEAIEAWKQVLSWSKKHLGPWHQQTAAVLSTLAELYSNQGQYEKAEILYARSLAISEKALGPSHPDTGIILNNLGLVYAEQGKNDKAIELYARALAISQKALGPEHPETASIINNLAAQYRDQGNLSKAESLYIRTLEIRNKVSGRKSPETAKALNNLAELYSHQARYKEAELLHEQALAIREKLLGPDQPEVGESLNNLAHLFSSQGRYEKARKFYLRSLSIIEKSYGPEHPDTAVILSNLASTYGDVGQRGEAISLLTRALSISEKVHGPEHPETGVILGNLAGMYGVQGQYARAEALFLRALAISESALGPFHTDTGHNLYSLAWLKSKQRKNTEAESLYLRALAIRENALGRKHPDVADTIGLLAVLYHDQGKYDKAEHLYLRALSIQKNALESDHPSIAKNMIGLALLYDAQRKYSEAEPLLLQALEITQRVYGQDSPYTSDAIKALAGLYGNQGLHTKAIGALRQSIQLDLNWLARELPLLPEQHRASQLEALGHAWEVAFSWIETSSEAKQLAFETRLNRQGLLSEIERRQTILSSTTGAKRDIAQTLQALTQRLASVSLTKDERHELRDQRDQLQRTLYTQLPDLEIKTVTASAVAQSLPKDGALVEFQQYRQFDGHRPIGQRWGSAQYIALVLKSDGTLTTVPLGSAVSINKLIHRALAATAQDQTDAKAIWSELSDRLLKPLLPELRSSGQWFFSPDAELNRVPFAALPTPEQPGTPLGEAIGLRMLTTGRELLRLQQASPKANEAIVMANPSYEYKAISPSAVLSREQGSAQQQRSSQFGKTFWAALPASEKEGQQVARLLSTRLISGAAASSRALQRSQSPRLLHVATHGFFVADQDSNASEPLRVLQDISPHLKAPDQEDPQLRSGLVLAGANHPEADPSDDGYLTAAEAVMLNLRGTELVVLSACSTGQGDIRTGEGVYGLQRALAVAGARSTLLSLWKVDDEATSEFMLRFYTRLKAGEGRSNALATTQKEFRNGKAGNGRWKEPYYWAAWQLVGDWRPIKGL